MAMVRQRGAKGSWELRVRHRLLPKSYHATFSSELEARGYGENLERLLASGHVPRELLETAPGNQPTLGSVIRRYLASAPVMVSAADVLDLVRAEHAAVTMDRITYRWAEEWLRKLKTGNRLTPGTIRKRIGALAQCLDWFARDTGVSAPNSLRMLPKGYSRYSEQDLMLSGLSRDTEPVDSSRDRRLDPNEEERIRAVLGGFKREDRGARCTCRRPSRSHCCSTSPSRERCG